MSRSSCERAAKITRPAITPFVGASSEMCDRAANVKFALSPLKNSPASSPDQCTAIADNKWSVAEDVDSAEQVHFPACGTSSPQYVPGGNEILVLTTVGADGSQSPTFGSRREARGSSNEGQFTFASGERNCQDHHLTSARTDQAC